MRANLYAGRARKISPQILCGAGQPALPLLFNSALTNKDVSQLEHLVYSKRVVPSLVVVFP